MNEHHIFFLFIQKLHYSRRPKIMNTKVSDEMLHANSADPDQIKYFKHKEEILGQNSMELELVFMKHYDPNFLTLTLLAHIIADVFFFLFQKKYSSFIHQKFLFKRDSHKLIT